MDNNTDFHKGMVDARVNNDQLANKVVVEIGLLLAEGEEEKPCPEARRDEECLESGSEGRNFECWMDMVRQDTQVGGMTEQVAEDRKKWRQVIRCGDP